MQPFDFALRDRRLTHGVAILMIVLGVVMLTGMALATILGHVS